MGEGLGMRMKFSGKRNLVIAISMFLTLGLLTVAFQNCSNPGFSHIESTEVSTLKNGGADEFHTTEDTPLEAELRSVGRLESRNTRFQLLSQPINGELTLLDENLGTFRYVPSKDFTGHDSFTFSEHPEGMEPIVRTAEITVDPDNDRPWIGSDSFSFDMNSNDNAMNITVGDIDDSALEVLLSGDRAITSLNTANGQIARTGRTSFTYTPNPNFRGVDRVELFVKDPQGGIGSKWVTINVGNPFRSVQPAMAVRAMGCVSCHAKVSSTVITDFGYGDPFFFGKRALSVANRSVFSFYSTTSGHSGAYSDHTLGSWLTSTIIAPIVVPRAPLGLDLNRQSYVLTKPTDPDTEANRTYINASIKPGDPILAATNLKEFVTAINNKKAAANRATAIEEKDFVFIGAPDAATLISKLGMANETIKFFKNTPDSPALSGVNAATAGSIAYTLATGKVTCDGDLGVRGILFLKDVTIETKEGCRIYVAGPVIQQGEIKYLNLDQSQGAKNLTNLQIVSSEMISMGIGPSHCESASNPGWYNTNPGPAATPNTPLAIRYGSYLQETRRIVPGSASANDRLTLLKNFTTAAGVQDASCRGGTAPRELHFNRLMVVAPNIQNRYTGQFTGVIIGEYALFALSKFTFKFDDVFKHVPVLPIIETSSYLDVK